MGILKKIVRNSLVGFCFLLATCIFAAVAVENKVQQYNAILDQNQPVFGCEPSQVLSRVQGSKQSTDNVAAIRIGGKTYVIVSSIIDEVLHEYFKKDEALPDPRPISVMDLLYLYKDADSRELIDGADLQAKVEQARRNPNRALVIAMMGTVVKLFLQKEDTLFQGEVRLNRENGELEVKLKKENKKVFPEKKACSALPRLVDLVNESLVNGNLNDLEGKKLAIIDFLNRLKKYAQDIFVIPDETVDPAGVEQNDPANVLGYTNHYASGRNRLIEEIDAQIGEIREIDAQIGEIAKAMARGMVNLVRLVRGPWLNIGAIWRLHKISQDVMEMKYVQGLNPNHYVAAITHTEQMIDWLSTKLGANILVKISGKAPCIKCSHYIQYAITPDIMSVKDAWNARTVIGFNVGWKSPEECENYRYPVKVFNTKPENVTRSPWTVNENDKRGTWLRQFTNRLDPKGVYEKTNFGKEELWEKNKDGTLGSNCYAIEDVDGYEETIQMLNDGSVVEGQQNQ